MSGARKRALVTGGAVRVGRAITLRLARDGYSVGIHYLRSEAEARSLAGEVRAAGGEAALFHADLEAARGAQDLAEEVLRDFSGLDLLVNNASIWEPKAPETIEAIDLDRHLAVNLRSPFLLSLRLGLAMRERGAGAIVNVLDWSIARPYVSYLPYGIAKAGLAEATRGLARAFAPEVRVNAVSPGPVLLPEPIDPERVEAIRRAVPLGRIGEPEDVADAVAYLASAPFVTGTILTVDGGRSLR